MKNKITYIPISILTLTTLLAGASLVNGGVSAATDSASASVTVADACAFATAGYTSVISAVAGTTYNTESDTSKTTASISCNNSNGFVVNARGDNGSTVLAGTVGGNIVTGTATSGGFSNWAFKVTNTSGSVVTGYNSYSAVPSSDTPIITFTGTSGTLSTGTFRTDYRIYVAPSQATDTYVGGVQYTITAI